MSTRAHESVPATTAAGDRAIARWVLPAVAVVALATRLGPVLGAGALRGVQGYDDGVHLAVAERLLAGIAPYRDEVFLHTPGIAVLLTPFAALAGPFGDAWALAAARVVFMVLGAVNAVLVARILAPRGVLAAAVGGGTYALWGAAVAAEHTVYLEAPIGLGLLVALAALRRAGPGSTARSPVVSRAVALSGLVIGLAFTVKIWVVIDAVVLGAMVLSRWGPRTAARWCAWGLLGAAPLLPFVWLAPGRFWYDVVVVQMTRPDQDKSLAGRVAALDPTRYLHGTLSAAPAVVVAVLLVAAVLGPLAVALHRRLRPAQWSDPVWWGLLAAAQLVTLARAPSFYIHYAAFVAPALSLLIGAGAGLLAARARARGGASARARLGVLTVAAVAAGLVLVAARPPLTVAGRVDGAVLADFGKRHTCVWARNPSYLQLAGVASRQLDAGCPATLDLVGTRFVLDRGGVVPGTRATTIDDLVLEQLVGSDGAIVGPVGLMQGVEPRATRYLRTHFDHVGDTGLLELWSRSE
ncbi:hypothetical protein [Pengzhenrongella phosphoraccumulans]|uniref:hypothetical protein n=1 Tax=Pengzhenrongella phosphoraccumulans TaxID=3114394 RepID=UPI00388D6A46